MRRENIRLRSLAKHGDKDAKLKLGEIYLVGEDGLARNIPLGLEYLLSLLPLEQERVVSAIARHLSIKELLDFGQIDQLRVAAGFDEDARLKLAAWLLIKGQDEQAFAWLERNDDATGDKIKMCLGAVMSRNASDALRVISKLFHFSIFELVAHEARLAIDAGNIKLAQAILRGSNSVREDIPSAVYQLVVDVIQNVEARGGDLSGISIDLLEASLEIGAAEGHPYACYALGRALAGMNCGHLRPPQLVRSPNLRKAAALLLQSGDAGISQAWLDLFRVCSGYRSSVGNPTMARFCLEKAAQQGLPEATRRLGVVVLREATQIHAMERGVALLFDAASKGDFQAKVLLDSLVLPVNGCEREMGMALREVERSAPLLAMRMRLAREFGLTKLEALSIDPSSALRPWGMVVGKNPFITKMGLSEPRAIPAVSTQALKCVEAAARMFSQKSGELSSIEGPLRSRALQQRRIFQRLDIVDDLFFAKATSFQRDAIRIGTRWAQRQKSILDQALA